MPSGDAVRPGETVEQALLQARELIGVALAEFQSLPETHLVERLHPTSSAASVVERSIEQERRTVWVSLSEDNERWMENLGDALDRRNLRKGSMDLRLLGTSADLEQTPEHVNSQYSESRVVHSQLASAFVIEGVSALFPAERGVDEATTVAVFDKTVVGSFSRLFADVWDSSLPWTDYLKLGEVFRSGTERQVLRQLAEGATDAVAAQKMSMSLRTYRRHVAEIMRRLNARSRFEAGVRAVELGLI